MSLTNIEKFRMSCFLINSDELLVNVDTLCVSMGINYVKRFNTYFCWINRICVYVCMYVYHKMNECKTKQGMSSTQNESQSMRKNQPFTKIMVKPPLLRCFYCSLLSVSKTLHAFVACTPHHSQVHKHSSSVWTDMKETKKNEEQIVKSQTQFKPQASFLGTLRVRERGREIRETKGRKT